MRVDVVAVKNVGLLAVVWHKHNIWDHLIFFMGHYISDNNFHGADLELDKDNNLIIEHAMFTEDTIIASKRWVKEHLDDIKKWSNS